MRTAAIESSQAHRHPSDPIALYVHIPFCLSKCNYCDFNTYAGIEDLMPSFVEALRIEIEMWGERLNRPHVSTVFFGGGTPSYLPSAAISSLLDSIRESMRIASDEEVTLEANPDDVSDEKCRSWLDAGFNRISIGVQSFNDAMLAALSRRHSTDTAVRAVDLVREAGFRNVNIDLMFGLPNQSMTMWRDTLLRSIDLGTEHLSLYGLQIEPGTPMHRDWETGNLNVPDDDVSADMYELAMEVLGGRRLRALRDIELGEAGIFVRAIHLAYWLNLPYLGGGTRRPLLDVGQTIRQP